MIKKIKNNLVFSVDFKSFYKSMWIGPLLITWCINGRWYQVKELEFAWYGWDYWS